MTETPSPAVDTPTPHTIRTDRPCAACGFNLYGQPIVREAHYNLSAARCPECGQLAALQEYPALGKWADRWARLLGALWVLALVGAMFAHFGPTLGLGVASVEIPREDVAIEIAAAHQAWADAQPKPAAPTANAPGVPAPPAGVVIQSYGVSTHSGINPEWFRTEAGYIRAKNSGRALLLRLENASFWFPLAVTSFAFGAFWSIALLGTHRLVALAVASVSPAIAFTFVYFVATSRFYDPAVLIARDAAAELIVPTMLPVTILMALIPLAIGVLVGRKLARLITRLALPPRMRSSLSILWTRDNLPPPSAIEPRASARAGANRDRAG